MLSISALLKNKIVFLHMECKIFKFKTFIKQSYAKIGLIKNVNEKLIVVLVHMDHKIILKMLNNVNLESNVITYYYAIDIIPKILLRRK